MAVSALIVMVVVLVGTEDQGFLMTMMMMVAVLLAEQSFDWKKERVRIMFVLVLDRMQSWMMTVIINMEVLSLL